MVIVGNLTHARTHRRERESPLGASGRKETQTTLEEGRMEEWRPSMQAGRITIHAMWVIVEGIRKCFRGVEDGYIRYIPFAFTYLLKVYKIIYKK